MIITRTPLRVSFFGGGTDYPAWYEDNGGSVLNTTINKYCYISCRYLPPFFDCKYLIRYSKTEIPNSVEEIMHPSVRECLKYLNIEGGIEMVHTSDIPARSGVGSSSSYTVGFLHALYALRGQIVTKRQLARAAIHVEQDLIKENVGSQDQVAAAFGGFNKIDFGGERDFYVTPITLGKEKSLFLQDQLMLFFTGFSRTASEVAGEQIKNIPAKKAELTAMKDMVDEAVTILNGGPEGFGDFGRLLHESWKLKRGLSQLVSTSEIDKIYETAMRAGALGGKLLGAGGGGFILFYVPVERQQAIKEKLKKFLYVPFNFEDLGTQIIMYAT